MAPSTAESTTPERVDVLIVTAVQLEYDAVLQVHTGAWEGSQWEERPGPTGFTVAFRTFKAANGAPLRVAVTRTLEMGGVAAANAAAPLVAHYRPSCLAMCGVCAGRRGKVQLGDVIIADRLWFYDTGKLKVEKVDGKSVKRIQGDMLTYNLRAKWKPKAEDFQPPADSPWLSNRPLPYETQMNWVLEQILQDGEPSKHPERHACCPDWKEVITRLWEKEWLQQDTLSLSPEGRAYIERLRLLHPEGLPAPKPFRVHVAPIGTGNQVVEDPKIFKRLSKRMRKVLGLEMEAAAIGAVYHQHNVPYVLVMKGVMDFADSEKSDHFKPFAARASAECLLAFLRENLLPPREDFSDVLKSGTSEPPRHLSPSALLNSRYELVPFYEPGRAEQLKDLQQWCDAPEAVSARLFHGPGGMGKTRLFIEWCRRLREQQGWVAGFLDQLAPLERFKSLVGYELPKLVVIDYAESRPGLVDLLKEVARCRNKAGLGRLRLVLLARNKGDWWESLLASDGLVKDLLRDTTPTTMAALAEVGAERDKVFLEAVRRFAGLRNRAAPERPSVDLAHPRFERVLYLHMAALATVEGLAFTGESLVEEVLEHEERFWRTCLGSELKAMQQWKPFAERAWRGVTTLTLLGGAAGRREARELLERVNESVDDALLQLLRDLYPGVEGGYVGGMEPDLLGEAVVLRTLHEEGKDAAETLRRIFEKADEQAVRHGLEVLGRLSVEHDEEAGEWIEEVIDRDVDGRAVAALEAAKAVGERTVHSALGLRLARVLSRKGTIRHAIELQAAGLPERTVSLREVALWVTETSLGHVQGGDDPEVMALRAGLLNNLGKAQSEVGQRERALESTQEAVDIRRELARRNPEAFLPDLAMSLNNLGARQSEVGQRERALESTQEAVGAYRELARRNPEAFLPDLAGSLNNLGAIQSEVGQRERALESTQEAVGAYRELARRNPEAFLPDVAMSLNNLGAIQSEVGQRKRALESTQEAVDIRRELARRNPEAFLPDLAASLNNLGARQSKVGQRERALESTQEAVGIRRELARRNPEAFLPDVAMSLNNLGTIQSEVGQRERALESTQEAVDAYRELARRNPEAFLPDLARSLNNLGARQSEVGQRERALESTQEAVDAYRELARRNPEAFLPDLAMSLNNLGARQSEVGQRERALESTQEAVDIRRELARRNPEAFLPDVAMSLNNLGAIQSEVGQRERALESTQEAVDIRRELARRNPEAFLPDLAMSLNNLGAIQSEVGQRERALESTQEAVDIRRELARRNPEAFLPDLAASLNNLGNRQSEVGQRERALESTQEAVGAYQELARRNPEAFLPDLARSLNNLGNRQSEVGQRERALESTQEAVGAYQELARRNPEAFLPDLARSLNNLGNRQSEVELHDESLRSAQAAVDALWPFFIALPQAHARNMGIMLKNVATRFETLGQPPSPEFMEKLETFVSLLQPPR